MVKRKLHLRVLVCTLALVLLIGLVTVIPMQADAARSDELRAQLNSLQAQSASISAQIAELRGQIAQNTSEIENMVVEKNIIDQEIFLMYQQITNINNQIATYSMLIADKQDELTAAEERYNTLLAENKERIQAMEEEGDVTYWSVLFQANSFADFLDRINMVQEIAASDRRRLDELNQAAIAVAEAKASLEEEKLALEETKLTLAEAQEELELKRIEASAILKALVARGMEYEELVAQSEAAQERLLQSIATTKVQYNNALYQEWLATSVRATTIPQAPSQTTPTEATNPSSGDNTGSTGTTGTTGGTENSGSSSADEGWKVPINYVANTSPFGEREQPTAGASTNHKGVDLAAPEGTEIGAAKSGTVLVAEYDPSAGYYVVIEHDNGYRSVYMHMSSFDVQVGQTVSQGETIGACGSTGVSTGSHLHFGISQNGQYKNPADYIPV